MAWSINWNFYSPRRALPWSAALQIRRTLCAPWVATACAIAVGWGMGMTILTALGSLVPVLAAEDRPLALFHGAVRVAEDTAGAAPRFDLEPLPATSVPVERLKAWFRRAVEVRDEDGAERVLQTAIACGASPTLLA